MNEFVMFLTHPAIAGMLLMSFCLAAVDWYVLRRFGNAD